MIAPGGDIGILGGGQLGRMLALAAAPLGYRCHIYAPEAEAPAAQVAERWTRAAYDDHDALRKFADSVDVITYEFENVPAATAEILSALKPLQPNAQALATAQDRLAEKNFARAHKLDVAPYIPVASVAALDIALRQIGLPAVLKTRRLGYDGKGQVIIRDAAAAADAFEQLGNAPCILETFVALEAEMSILAARAGDGTIAFYPLAENQHKNHILDRTNLPAKLSDASADRARHWIEALLRGLDYVGVLALELFVSQDGDLLFNEMAPRVHNSGHWSQDAAVTSQFEQHIRAICGLPLGDPSLICPVEMVNLIGDDTEQWQKYLAMADAHLHIYGKSESRPGRKMGHVNILKRD